MNNWFPFETPFAAAQTSRPPIGALPSSGLPVIRSLPSGLAFAGGSSHSARPHGDPPHHDQRTDAVENDVSDTANDNRRSNTAQKRNVAQSRYVALFEGCGASRGEVGLALIDVHRPYLETSQFSDTASFSRTLNMLENFRPDEILLPDTVMQADRITQLTKLIFDKFQSASIVYVSRRSFNSEKGLEKLERVCAQQYEHVNLELRTKYYCVSAANALMNFVEAKLGVTYVDHSLVVSFEVGQNSTMIDPETLRCLEVLENSRGQHALTLFGVLNQTVTLSGSRLLRSELIQPLLNVAEITKRHEAIDELLSAPDKINEIRRTLKQVIDIDKPILLCVQREHARLIADDSAQRMVLNSNNSHTASGSHQPAATPSQSVAAKSNASCEEPRLPTTIKSILRRVPIHRAEKLLTNVLALKYMLEMVDRLRLILENLAPTSKWLCDTLEAFQNEELREVSRKLDEFLEENANFQRERLGLRTNMCFALKTKVNSFVDMERCAYLRLVSEVDEYVNSLSNKHQLQFQMKWNAKRKFHLSLHEGELLSKLYGNNADYEVGTPKVVVATEGDSADVSPEFDDAVTDHENEVWTLNSLVAMGKVEKEAYRIGLPKEFIRISKFKHTYMCTTAKLLCLNEQINRQLHDIYVLSSMVLENFIGNLSSHIGSLLRVSESIAMLDLLVAFAHICTVSDYVRPTFADQSKLEYRRMRHPILDKVDETNPTVVIANDLVIDQNSNMQIIFGANMSGKSTYLKQVALLQIMAQIGCYLPAEFANIRVFDQIFTRIGFDDRLESCESTFTTEVIDVKYIMDHATSKSLVLIDEFGRSTSHEEGLALCFAILERMALGGAFTLAATHFHELAVLEKMYDNILSFHFPCELRFPESNQDGTAAKAKLCYSHVIQRGKMPPSQHNYGLLLAELCTNLPASMIADAKEIQKRYLEVGNTATGVRTDRQVDTVRLERENLHQRYAMRLFEIATRSTLKSEELQQFITNLRNQLLKEEAQLEVSQGGSDY